jgi:hypothetical protein
MSDQAPSPTANTQEDTVPVGRKPKTHISDALIDIFKNLPLPLRLQRNKEIEVKNNSCYLQTVRHTEDPVANPAPGSEAASFITIDSSEVKFLSSPGIFDSLRDSMPFFLIQKLAFLKMSYDSEKTAKRRDPDSLTDLIEDGTAARMAKRRCMSANMLTSRNLEQPTSFNFPQIMFDTEDRMPIPLPFFTHKSLRYLIDHLAILSVRKVEADSVHKKCAILDIEALEDVWRGTLTYLWTVWGSRFPNVQVSV